MSGIASVDELKKLRSDVLHKLGNAKRHRKKLWSRLGIHVSQGSAIEARTAELVDTSSPGVEEIVRSQPSCVRMVTRSWEEKFMRAPQGSERPCQNSEDGTCFGQRKNADGGFALVEFYSPEEIALISRNLWKWPDERRLCVLCQRVKVYRLWLNCRCDGVSLPSTVECQVVGNYVGVPGEYCDFDVFVTSSQRYEGVKVPVVIPRFGDYDEITINGTKHLRQNLAYPTQCDEDDVFFFRQDS